MPHMLAGAARDVCVGASGVDACMLCNMEIMRKSYCSACDMIGDMATTYPGRQMSRRVRSSVKCRTVYSVLMSPVCARTSFCRLPYESAEHAIPVKRYPLTSLTGGWLLARHLLIQIITIYYWIYQHATRLHRR